MKNFNVSTGKNFTPLFNGAKAELYTLKGKDGGPQAIGQFYEPEMAQLLADLLNSRDRIENGLYGMGNDFDFYSAILDAEDEINKNRVPWQGKTFSTVKDRVIFVDALKNKGFILVKLSKEQ